MNDATSSVTPPPDGLLGDTRARTYADKLRLFNRFAEPELRSTIAELGLQPGQHVLDAGCGVGLTCMWLRDAVAPDGLVIGIELADAHARLALSTHPNIAQANIAQPPFAAASFDLIWCSNTINHTRDSVTVARELAEKLRPGGRLVIGQSAFLPEMVFAWDARLEDAVTMACRSYYRHKYGLSAADLATARNTFGIVRRAGLVNARAHTVIIERTVPLSVTDEAYLVECVFRGYWGEKIRPFMRADDWDALMALCDPASPAFCLRRDDFHYLQTYTVVVGCVE
jgi:SAM-dependent methyltransferase